MKAILKRRSIRKYINKDVDYNIIKDLLIAGMAAPSAGNRRPWEFIVIKNKEMLNKISEVHPSGNIIKQVPLLIVVCYDENIEKYKGCGVQDCSAAIENIMIDACDRGLSTCWLGLYMNPDRIKGLRSVIDIPENIMPSGMIVVGYGDEEKGSSDKYDENKVHFEKW